MGLFDFFRRWGQYDEDIEELSEEEKVEIINVDGYEIDAKTGVVISVPEGLKIYNLPLECKGFSSKANLTMLASAEEVNFHPESKITELDSNNRLFSCISVFGNLKKVTLPNTLKTLKGIGYESFKSKGIIYNIPDQIEEISYDMIPPYIQEINLSNVKSIGFSSYILTHNYGLKFLELPKNLGVKKVPRISNAQALETLVIPEGYTSMDSDGLFGCNNLIDVYIPNSLSRFVLSTDDYRSLAKPDGSSFSVDAIKCQNRKIRLHKTIGNDVVIFEVSRDGFYEFAVDDKEVKFFDNYNNFLVIPLESIMMNSYYIVDIKNQKIQKHSSIDQEKQELVEDCEEEFVSRKHR